MYSFYLNPTAYNSSLTLNDYIQLQRVLAREQIKRQRIYEQEAALKAYQEKIRIQNAIRQLQVITELRRQREREERAVQAYYLEKARREQEQEQIRQERERLYYQNYLNTLQNNCYERKPAVFFHPNDALASSIIKTTNEEVSDNESEDEEDNHYNQLADVINLIFGVPNRAEQKEQENTTQEEVSCTEEQVHDFKEVAEEAEEEDLSGTKDESPVATEVKITENKNSQQNNSMDVDQFIEFFSEKLKKFNEAEDLENEEKQKQAQLGQETQEDESEIAEPNIMPLLEDEPEDQDMEEAEDFVSLAIQHIDDSEPAINDETSTTEVVPSTSDEVPTLEQPENIVNLVNELVSGISQNNSLFPDEDPVKLAKYDALSRIEQELDDIQQKNENILRNSLDFDTNSLDSDTIYANTTNNREFLGYEDQIMKVLLKLDMIQSDGDEEIRTERKSLVKRAENLLETLDDFKHREWERVSNSSHCSDEEFEMA